MDSKQTANYPSSNSTAISNLTAGTLQSRRRSNKIETPKEEEGEHHQQQTTRFSNEIPPFDYSLLGPPPKTTFGWVKLIFRQYRALGTRYKTELIAGRTLSVLVDWLPLSIYANIRSLIELRYPPIQMPPPPPPTLTQQTMKKNEVSRRRSAGNR